MDEVREFCRRVLGAGATADEVAQQARAAAGSREDRIELLAGAARACRDRAEVQEPEPAQEPSAAGSPGLTASVAGELARATASLPERQREALALRELLDLSHRQISQVMGIEPAAVAPLLARARLRLRSERRNIESERVSECAVRDRALRLLACRQDSEACSEVQESWLLEHLGACPDCAMAHAAMLEAAWCYRVWVSGASSEAPAR